MRKDSLLSPFSEGDRIIVINRFGPKDLMGKKGIITGYLGGGFYKVFIPEWPPCFLDGEEGLEWRMFYRDIERWEEADV